MADYVHNPNKENTTTLDEIWDHILVISKGKCDITDETLENAKDENYRLILGGLKMLYEDLEAYKEDFVKKIEAEHQLELLKQKNEELERFNYVASHDLQEPLRTISSYSTILQQQYSNELDEKGQKYLRFISESSQRMRDLIYDLLMHSNIGKEYEVTSLNCNEIIIGVLNDLEQTISETNPIIRVANLPIISGNKTGIRQIFQNLISNALKFKKKDEQSEIDITVESSKKYYTFCVADNGIGIDSKYKKRIFGVFQRLHSKKEFKGTGIGLASCKKIVEMHNGKIWLESEIGVGSKFYFSILKE